MLDLLYLSRTVVPAHLSELEQLDVLYRDEQVLVALDGVLMDESGSRLSGPTLHDYCLLTGNRVLLWARDYAEHTCYAFPLHELREVTGQGMDPLHAQLHLLFCGEDEAPQRVTLSLLPLADLPMALMLLGAAADAARDLEGAGLDAVDMGGEVAALLSAKMYGDAEAPAAASPRLRGLSTPPYRWSASSSASPGPTTSSVEAAPEVVYQLGRVGRSAWDTLVRSVRESELPFDLKGTDLRDLTSLMQAANDLLGTISSRPEARETVLGLFNSMSGGMGSSAMGGDMRPQAEADDDEADDEVQAGSYREIPLKRSEVAAVAQTPEAPADAAADFRGVPLKRSEVAAVAAQTPADAAADFRGIPLRRRAAEVAAQTRVSQLPAQATNDAAEPFGIPLRRRASGE